MLRYFFNPLVGIKHLHKEAKASAHLHKDNIDYIRQLRNQVTDTQFSTLKEQANYVGRVSLIHKLMMQKRISLILGAFFVIPALFSAISGSLVALPALLIATTVFSLLAVINDYRIWQVRHGYYKATGRHYMARNPHWWLNAFNPQLTFGHTS